MDSERQILDDIKKAVKRDIKHLIINQSTAVISETIAPGVPYRLLSLDLHASAVLDTTEVLTITKQTADNLNTVILSEDLFIGSRTSYHAIFGEGYEFEGNVVLIIAQANGSPDAVGIDVTYELL